MSLIDDLYAERFGPPDAIFAERFTAPPTRGAMLAHQVLLASQRWGTRTVWQGLCACGARSPWRMKRVTIRWKAEHVRGEQ